MPAAPYPTGEELAKLLTEKGPVKPPGQHAPVTQPPIAPAEAPKPPIAAPPPQPIAAPPPQPSAPPPAQPGVGACPAGPYHGVQIGVFRSLRNATGLRDKMSAKYGPAQVHVKELGGRLIYWVIVGCMDQRNPAEDLLKKLQGDGIQGLVVRATASAMGDRL